MSLMETEDDSNRVFSRTKYSPYLFPRDDGGVDLRFEDLYLGGGPKKGTNGSQIGSQGRDSSWSL